MDAWAKAVSAFAPHSVVRFERAGFCNGYTMEAVLAYYDDLLSALNQYGLGWYSTDYVDIMNSSSYAGSTRVLSADGYINADLLKILQKWQ